LNVTIQLTIAEFDDLRKNCDRHAAEFGLIANFKMMRLKGNDRDRVILIECERGQGIALYALAREKCPTVAAIISSSLAALAEGDF
jgi:hypothetical protein